ncbi:Gsa protein [Gordonia sp. 852002-51296_SCH5728562-b]|nr:Gsa protein [Gordonia sp. 852002-51296_SCH5728562-b]
MPAPVETETASPPKVSVITICFKDLAGLHKTVDSLRAQEYAGEIEHIIVDGGSGQETTDYLQSLEPQPDHWVSEPDGGRYDAMNKGIEKATGDLIWLMHAGDAFADPDAVDSMVTLLSAEGQPRANWGYGRVRAIGRRGPVPTVWGAVPFDTHQFMIGSQPIPHQATVIGADLAKALGPYDLEFGLAADQLYLFRATLVKPPLTVARVVCDFDSGGAGSIRPMRDSFDDLRRGWDLFGVYPFGSRRKARLHSRYRQILATVVFALSKHGADSE